MAEEQEEMDQQPGEGEQEEEPKIILKPEQISEGLS